MEARVQDDTRGPVDKTVKFTAIWASPIVGAIYVLGALLVSFDVDWDDPQLPRLNWLTIKGALVNGLSLTSPTTKPDSAFVIAAHNSIMAGSQKLANAITACIIFTAFWTANTTLYISSRTLFSLTKGIQDGPDSPFLLKFLAYFGKTNHRRVPMRAIIASSCFFWVPFLYLTNSNAPGTRLAAVSLKPYGDPWGYQYQLISTIRYLKYLSMWAQSVVLWCGLLNALHSCAFGTGNYFEHIASAAYI